ncbi:MAG: heparinase II/III-family protein [Hyphomicrobiaceae bacterium]
MSIAIRLRTAAKLGPANVVRVAAYRAGLKTGLGRVRRLKAQAPRGPFFPSYDGPARAWPVRQAWRRETTYFGWLDIPFVGGRPDWFRNPLTGRCVGAERPWWEISDFDAANGDIKTIWEPSRFDWVLAIAQGAASREPGEAARLEDWLGDWCRRNPPYLGPNWKCGQEASIRVMHLAMASLILSQRGAPLPGLRDLLRVHLARIAPTIGYALGQDNNHGTSEAAALFIGGSWLHAAGGVDGARWADLGRRLMENRIARLVAPDGSFSQHSLTYHRVLADTLSMAEVWRRARGLPPFSRLFYERAAAAAIWFFTLIEPGSGDGPNLGANDGARLLPLTDTGYRDFRPSVQTAMALFAGRRAYDGEGVWNLPLHCLGIALPQAQAEPPASRQFDDGGYAVLRVEKAMALLRYPRFRFRPSQGDALHVDLWVGGSNVLRDAGTFSYNADRLTLDTFNGTAGHNTVQFDRRDQMPRLGRFLFGEWLKADTVGFDKVRATAEAGFTDWRGARHHRQIVLEDGRLAVRDHVAGRFSSAVLRWRLVPGDWSLDGQVIRNGAYRLSVRSEAGTVRNEIVHGRESLHYLEQHEVPVLEIEVRAPTRLISEFTWR